MLSRKHFEGTADVLRRAYQADVITATQAVLLTQAFAEMFAADNPRFDSDRFARAVGAR